MTGPGLRHRMRWRWGRVGDHSWRRVAARVARVNEAPILLLGNQKSGTTAIAALLARHTGRSVTLDVPALWGDAERAIRAGEVRLEDVVRRDRLRFSRDIVKEPALSFIADAARAAFPAATLVTVVRDPRDNLRSVFDRLGLPGDRQVDAETPAGLSEHWRAWLRPEPLGLPPGSTHVDVAAHRWNLAADTWLEHPDDVLLVRYEDFLQDKAGYVAGLADRLGLPHVQDVAAETDTDFQPRGDRDVRWDRFFGADGLRRVNALCGPRMERLGYDPALLRPAAGRSSSVS